MKRIASVWKLFDLRIVTGRDIICSDIQASLQERFPFYISITGNTRIRCPSIFIFIYKIINDMFFEFFLEIHNVIRNIELRCHTPGIIHSRKSAASGMGTHHVPVLILPYLHGNSYYIVALLLEQKCGNRRVDSA